MLEELKERLKITWNDEDDDLTKILDRGKSYFKELTGTELVFDSNTQAGSLLLEYGRYAYNNALEYFEENFSKEILRLQLQEGVKADAI